MFRLPAITLGVVLAVTVACRHDAVTTSPMVPTSPDPAVYSNGTWLVNSLADPGVGTCTNSECTLREAIAVAQSGEHITFKSNLQGTIALTAGELEISRGITIDGPGADRIAVSGEGASRVFLINLGPGVTISGLTVTRGSGLFGGGFYVDDGARLTLIGAVVSGNSADVRGGGIYSLGQLSVAGSTIAANRAIASTGGGIFTGAPLTVRRSTISGNSANQGGGISVLCSAGCPVTISSSTITANTATLEGGGILEQGDGFTVFNTIIAGNRGVGSISGLAADCSEQSSTSLGFNLTGLGTGCTLAEPSDVHVTPAQIFTTVLEGVLAANGSSRPTHALIERGYAVDAGYCPGENGDQRGFPRPYDDPVMPNALDACDIGAFEWNPTDTKNNPK